MRVFGGVWVFVLIFAGLMYLCACACLCLLVFVLRACKGARGL